MLMVLLFSPKRQYNLKYKKEKNTIRTFPERDVRSGGWGHERAQSEGERFVFLLEISA